MAATTALVAGTVAASAYTSRKSGKAAEKAAEAQSESADAGIAEQRRQFDQMVKLLSPYVSAGTGAITQQQELLGIKGGTAQKKAISAIESSPYFQSVAKQGENAILQNASATGNLRGGNAIASLAQFRPGLLNQLVQQQFQNLGGLTQIGQASAAGQASAGMQTGSNIANLLGQQGQAIAGGQLGQAAAQNQLVSGLLQAGGLAYGLGGF